MLSFLLFIVGLVMFKRQKARLDFFGINTHGQPARTAGWILMLPLSSSFILAIVTSLFMSDDLDVFWNTIQALACLELIMMIFAARTAYNILKQASSDPTAATPINDPPVESPKSTAPNATYYNYPSILTVAEAARYLNITEKQILDAIDNNKLAASRMSDGYRIARRALDDYRQDNLP